MRGVLDGSGNPEPPTSKLRMYNAFVVTTQCVAPYFGARLDLRFRGSTGSRSATAANGARFLEIQNAHEYADGHSNQKEKSSDERDGDDLHCTKEERRKGGDQNTPGFGKAVADNG